MGENYPKLHDLVRYGQEREKAQLRLVHSEKEWEAGLIVSVCLILGALLIVGLVMFR